MSGSANLLEESLQAQGFPETACPASKIVKTDIQNQQLDFKDSSAVLNGDKYSPNNNLVYNSAVTTECSVVVTKEDFSVGEEAIRALRNVDSTESEDTDDASVNNVEDTGSLNDDTTTTTSTTEGSQNADSVSKTPEPSEHPAYNREAEVEDGGDNEDHLHQRREYNNGAVKKSKSRNKKSNSSGPGRGRPRKSVVAMYHSQISGDKNTIKIRIKKNFCAQMPLTPNKKKSARRKRHKQSSDTDASDYEKKPKRSKSTSSSTANFNSGGNGAGGGSTPGECDVSSTQDEEPLVQGPWGDREKLPEELLRRIFEEACVDGCLPTVVRLGKVCRLWRDVSLSTSIWKKADLNFVKEKMRTDLRLHWLLLNKLPECHDLSMGEWKVRDIQSVLEALCEHCTELRGLNMSGWKGLNNEHLKYLTTECKKLERLDLSSINVSNSTSAINAQPLVALSQSMNTRLTHLVLAHNKIAGFTQIVSSIAAHCPNLELLDISNIRTFAHNTALLHVEKLQIGCPKLKVLRITNSQIWLAPATLTEQVASPGFPMLEELSLAGLEEDQTTTSRSMDDDGIERLLKCSTKLRLLDIRGCTKLTDSGLVRVPAWDLEHLFLSACYITRLQNSGLELIMQKWSHSLLEVDLAWSTATASLDAAVLALAEKGSESKLQTLNLCGSSISLEPVKAVLRSCPSLRSINLQSCRALPRGIKRLYSGEAAVDALRKSLTNRRPSKTEEDETSPGGGEATSPADD